MIALPMLDDKRFRQIFDEAVARIPTLTDEWTDFNPQDTGIMLLEILAAMTELQNYYLDRVGSRFYEKYLELVTEPVPGEATGQRMDRFAREMTQSDVAVTLRDYERLAMLAPFGIEQARADLDGGWVCLTVLRGSRPLDSAELCELRGWLEPYRLLTARLKIEQAVCRTADIVCRVVMDGLLERESICREKLETIFRQRLGEQRLGQALRLDNVRLDILSMREIIRIDELTARPTDGDLWEEEQNRIFTRVRSVEITVAQ